MTYIRSEIDIDVNDVFTVDVKLKVADIAQFIENCSHEEKQTIFQALAYKPNIVIAPRKLSLLDGMKYEFFHENFHKISMDDLVKTVR